MRRPTDKRTGPVATPAPPRSEVPNELQIGDSVADGRAEVVDLAARRRRRHAPAGGDWWGSAAMWTWGQAEASRWRWPA